MVGLIEQVPDLISPKFWQIWASVKLVINSMTDYIWDFRVMNAADYGSRQNRKRLIIMLVRRDLGVPVSFPEPTPADLSKVSVHSLLPEVYYFSPGQFKDGIKCAESNVFCTMTATDSQVAYGFDGKARPFTIEEKLVLTELEGLNLGKISKTKKATLLGNMVQVSFAESLFRHIKEEILQVGRDSDVSIAA